MDACAMVSPSSCLSRAAPEFLKRPVRRVLRRRRLDALRTRILRWYEGLDGELQPAMRGEIEWIRARGAEVFPYPWAEEAARARVRVERDADGMPYVVRGGRELFFPPSWKDARVREYYRSLLREQHRKSPHRYSVCGESRLVGLVLYDIGAAEGIWAFDNADRARHIVLCEPNLEWQAPLGRTFSRLGVPFSISTAFVSAGDRAGAVGLDTLTRGRDDEPVAVKMDIEGEEARALEGARETLLRRRTTLWEICLYHNPMDAQEIADFFRQNAPAIVDLDVAEGYMVFTDERIPRAPYLRRGLLRVVQGREEPA